MNILLNMSHAVYAVASGKGGVGKTTTTVNLGTMLAAAGHEVVVVDADLGMANLADFLGLQGGESTLHDVLAGEASVESAVQTVDGQSAGELAVVPSGVTLDEFGKTDPENLEDVIDTLRDSYDFVLVDTGAGLSYDTVLPLGLADAVLLVSKPTAAAVRDTNKTRQVADRIDGTVVGAVLTHVDKVDDIDTDAVADRLDTPVLATVPRDKAVRESVKAGSPLVAHAPDSVAAGVYDSLATLLAADDAADAPSPPIVPESPPDEDDEPEPNFDPEPASDDDDGEPEFPRFDEDDDPLSEGEDDLSDIPDLD